MDSCKIRAKEKKHFRNTFLRSCLHIQKKSSNFAKYFYCYNYARERGTRVKQLIYRILLTKNN